jgi:hypothetical protein
MPSQKNSQVFSFIVKLSLLTKQKAVGLYNAVYTPKGLTIWAFCKRVFNTLCVFQGLHRHLLNVSFILVKTSVVLLCMIPPLFAIELNVDGTNSPFFEQLNGINYAGGIISQDGDYNTNRNTVFISGTLDNSGTLTNSGFLTSNTLTNSGFLTSNTLTNSGILNNLGTLVNSNGNTLTNSGFLNNSNIFNNSGTLTFNMGSILQRTGTLRFLGGSVVDQNNTQLNWPIQVLGNTSITSELGNIFTLNSEITGTVGSLVFNGPGITKLIKDNTGYTGGAGNSTRCGEY